MIILIHKISSHKYFIQMAGPAFTRIHRLFRTIIVCYRSYFTNFCFSARILSNTKKNSLFHTVGYKNHSVGYIFHSVGYKSRTVKQRICKSVLKNVTGYAELINRAERIITYSDLHGKGYCNI